MSALSIARAGIGFGAKLVATIGIGATIIVTPPSPPAVTGPGGTGGGWVQPYTKQSAVPSARVADDEAVILAIVAFVLENTT